MKKIGVFVCHCGFNIAGVVDVGKVVEAVSKLPGVAHAQDYIYMWSDPGQEIVLDAISQKGLDGIVVANCSPTLHEVTFRNAAQRAGLNPYLVEIANIREQCSWPHSQEPETATQKAIGIVERAIEKLKLDKPLTPITVPITKRALVIGGGIAGIQASLDIADGGYEVILVEKTPSIGGRMIQLSETFPTLDCPQCIETPKMVSCGQHPNITIYPYSEVEEVKGYLGNFDVTIRRKASCVDNDKCNGCGECIEKCLTFVTSDFDLGLSKRKAIYTPFPQAVPNRPVIDRDHCGHFTTGLCNVCYATCPKEAIDYDQQDSLVTEKVGVIVVATGFELLQPEKLPEYGGGTIPDVVNGLQFERILSPSGPTYGEVVRPSDYTVPKEVVFIQCAGSRDPEHGLAYCSKVCCMYTGKQAMLYKHAVPDGQAYVFYMDIRSDGKGYEEFISRTQEEEGVLYFRGRVSKLFRENGKVKVWGVDTLTGKKIEIAADMVVLATGVMPDASAMGLSKKLRLAQDEYGWFKEAHLKLRPLESMTSGIYLAGFAQYPKDITDTVSQASGAASKVLALFSQDKVRHEPVIAEVDSDICAGCGYCEQACAYEAVSVDPARKVAVVNEVLCEGCGACAAACPSGAMTHRSFAKKQLLEMVGVASEPYDKATSR